MIHILADSCCDINPELIQQYEIELINLSVFIDNQTFQDRSEINYRQLFSLVEKTGDLPKTSAPSIAEFQKFLDREDETIYIGISEDLSATLNNARLASENFPGKRIWIIDSSNLSSGIGLLVIKAAELRNAGFSASQIVNEVQKSIPKVHTSFVIDTLEYLYKGGRCSAISMVMGSLLKIRPIIEVKSDGTLGIKEKIMGTRRKALNSLISDFKDNLNDLDPHRVFITHTGCEQDAVFLGEALQNLSPIENLHFAEAGATIASHCGPNTIGVIYLTK